MKKYDLKLKQVFLTLGISILFTAFGGYMLFFATNEERNNMFIDELKFSIKNEYSVFGSVYICALFAIPITIYMLELLIYKIKDVLILSEDGITYYAPEYGKVFIPKDKIKDIYIINSTQMKIILKDYNVKKGIRAKFWNGLKNIFLGSNSNDIFRINLSYIKSDAKELREYLMQLNLDAGSSEANKLVKDILKQYNYNDIQELKKDEKVLSECVMKLYNMEKFSQVEIASIVKISTTKVSKIIRKNIN